MDESWLELVKNEPQTEVDVMLHYNREKRYCTNSAGPRACRQSAARRTVVQRTVGSVPEPRSLPALVDDATRPAQKIKSILILIVC